MTPNQTQMVMRLRVARFALERVASEIITESIEPDFADDVKAEMHACARALIQMKFATARRISADPPPRFDDIFIDGVEWLNRMGGEEPPR